MRIFNAFNVNIKRWDFARYLILLRFGGLYIDLDVELLKDIKEVVITHSLLANSPCQIILHSLTPTHFLLTQFATK